MRWRSSQGFVSLNLRRLVESLFLELTSPSLSHIYARSIAVLKLDAELSHITVPSAIASAFLQVRFLLISLDTDPTRCSTRPHPLCFVSQASVKNASPYPLLPGPTTIYLDGSLVGRGRMGDVSPEETFKVSLGVDGGEPSPFL